MKRNRKATRILVLAALCALSAAGCKKKEPVDLSSLHSTAAIEKETMAETEAETTAPAIENESRPAQSGFALTTGIKKESIGESTVEYPVISSMEDEAMQEKVNALLKSNALTIAEMYPDDALDIQSEVESINLKRITVLYTGENGDGDRIFFTNTVDLENATNLGLSDFADPYTMAGYIASGDYKLSDVSGNESSIRSFLNSSEKTVEYYYEQLQKADFAGGYDSDSEDVLSWPEIFSYEKQGVIFVSLPVPENLGSYVLIHYSPDNK